jgi:hypothetical protein
MGPAPRLGSIRGKRSTLHTRPCDFPVLFLGLSLWVMRLRSNWRVWGLSPSKLQLRRSLLLFILLPQTPCSQRRRISLKCRYFLFFGWLWRVLYKVRKFVFPVWRHIDEVIRASLHFSHAYVHVITESTNKTMTREDLLQMRSKKKSDSGNTILFSMRSFCHLVCKGVILKIFVFFVFFSVYRFCY